VRQDAEQAAASHPAGSPAVERIERGLPALVRDPIRPGLGTHRWTDMTLTSVRIQSCQLTCNPRARLCTQAPDAFRSRASATDATRTPLLRASELVRDTTRPHREAATPPPHGITQQHSHDRDPRRGLGRTQGQPPPPPRAARPKGRRGSLAAIGRATRGVVVRSKEREEPGRKNTQCRRPEESVQGAKIAGTARRTRNRTVARVGRFAGSRHRLGARQGTRTIDTIRTQALSERGTHAYRCAQAELGTATTGDERESGGTGRPIRGTRIRRHRTGNRRRTVSGAGERRLESETRFATPRRRRSSTSLGTQ